MSDSEKLSNLENHLKNLYTESAVDLPFHGWHHIKFVREKALEFAAAIKANLFWVETAALTHDLNVIYRRNSEPEDATSQRRNVLLLCGYTNEEIEEIEKIILDAHTSNRVKLQVVSPETMALSDADTLFKALPITPIIFANKYLLENNMGIANLAKKVISEQNPLMETDRYFYTDIAKKRYLKWAKTNLDLWNNVMESLAETGIQELLHELAIPSSERGKTGARRS